MPTPIKTEIFRTWCKRCLELEFHKWIKIDFSDVLICDKCGNEDNGYSLNEVPEDKIQQQRLRYKEMKRKKFEAILEVYTNPLKPKFDIFSHIFSEPNIGYTDIVECDAGQKRIDDLEKQKQQKLNEEKQLIINDYKLNYSKLNRNDKCPCNSNKKYKSCHLLIFRNYKFLKL